jgi:hypothetical protein
MRDFFLDILQISKLIEYTTCPRDLLRKHMMCNLMKQMGSQDEKENLDDVRGEELSRAMKTMAIGDIMDIGDILILMREVNRLILSFIRL